MNIITESRLARAVAGRRMRLQRSNGSEASSRCLNTKSTNILLSPPSSRIRQNNLGLLDGNRNIDETSSNLRNLGDLVPDDFTNM